MNHEIIFEVHEIDLTFFIIILCSLFTNTWEYLIIFITQKNNTSKYLQHNRNNLSKSV